MSKRQCVVIDGLSGEVADIPTAKNDKRYRCRLDTLNDVKNEMAKLYRETRSGILDVSDASKLVYCLKEIGKIITDSDIETRLTKLENDHAD